MRDEHSRITPAAASIVAVVMGSPAGADEFCIQRALPFRCLADPDKSAYRAFAVPEAGPGRWMIDPRMARRFVSAVRRGVGVGLPRAGQDVRQMPATFVISRGGTVRLAHYADHAADYPPMKAVLGALGVG